MKKPFLKATGMMGVVGLAFLGYLALFPGAADALIQRITAINSASTAPADSPASLSPVKRTPPVKQPIKVYGRVLEKGEFALLLTGRKVDRREQEITLDVVVIDGPATAPRPGQIWVGHYFMGSFGTVQFRYGHASYSMYGWHRLFRYVTQTWVNVPSPEASDPYLTDWKLFHKGVRRVGTDWK